MNIKPEMKKFLPKDFKVIVSHNGLNVFIIHKVNNDIDKSERLVKKTAKKFKLEDVESGTDVRTMTRCWEFVSSEVENEMHKEAKAALQAMKAFFKKWGNSYCSSSKTYDVIDKMRALVETDEN